MNRLPKQIIKLICDHLMALKHEGDPDGSKTVVALAQTCIATHEAALDVIWHTIPDYSVLIYSLPPGSYWKTEMGTKCGLEQEVFVSSHCSTHRFCHFDGAS